MATTGHVVRWAWILALNLGSVLLFALFVANEGLPPSYLWYSWPIFSATLSVIALHRIRRVYLQNPQKDLQISLVDLLIAAFAIAAALAIFRNKGTDFFTNIGIPISFILGIALLAGMFWASYSGLNRGVARYLYAASIVVRTYGILCLGAMLAGTIVVFLVGAKTPFEFWDAALFGSPQALAERTFFPLRIGLYALFPGVICCWLAIRLSHRARRVPPLAAPEKITSSL